MPLSASWRRIFSSARIAAWLGRGQPAQQLGGQGRRAGLGQRRRGRARPRGRRRASGPRGAAGAQSVSFWPVTSRSQRKKGIDAPAAGVLGEAAADLQVGLLEHVGGVDPAREPAVEAEADHPPQPLAVAVEQLGQGRLVAGASAGQEVVGLARIAGHGGSPIP